MIRNLASRIEKTSLKNDCVVIFFCGSRNRRLASDKNLLIIFRRKQTLKAQLMSHINFVAIIFFFEVDALVVVVLKEKGRFVWGLMDPILANHRMRNESHEIKVVPFTFYARYPPRVVFLFVYFIYFFGEVNFIPSPLFCCFILSRDSHSQMKLYNCFLFLILT